jgi:PAS domain S-box-containing protein
MLARIYGYDSPEELIGTVQDIRQQIYVEPGRRAEFIRLMQEHEVITHFESQVRRKDGRVIWISENARAVRDHEGRLLYYEGTLRDITDRKRAEEALRDSEVLYHSLVENLPANLFRKDLTERFTFANGRFCETLGRPLGEILGKTDFDFYPADLARKYQQDDRRVMETQQPFEAVEGYQTPDGETHYVEVIKTPLYDAKGKVLGVQGIFWDVTQRKRIEQALARERDLLRALLDHVPDRIYFKDTQSRFLKCSRALAERLGLEDPEQAVGKTDFDFHPREKAQEFFDDEQRILGTGVPLINKVEKQTARDGSPAWASVTKVPVYSHAGQITGLIGISRDITALKKIEAELEINRDAALELARQKSHFLATMSHEIRTPMNAILGMIGLLLDTRLSSKQRDFADTIRTSAEALLAIINDILDLSKIEAGKFVFEQIDFDLREAVEATVDLLAPRAQAKGIELMSIVPADVPVDLRGDPGRLRQVLTNLVGNAVKFTERGEIVLRVDRESQTPQEVVVRFSVRDTGIGVPSEAQTRIFQAFTQADGSTTRKYGGTGLGLAISKQLVELQGGEIGVESQPGEGSTFWFRLRFVRQPAGDAVKPAPRFPHLRALVVDRNATKRELLREKLALWAVPTELAAGSDEALVRLRDAAAAGNPFRIVFAGQDPPEVDGLGLARAVRAEAALGKPQVVLLTALDQPFEAAVLHSAGVFAVLAKPVRQARLLDCLQEVEAGAEGSSQTESWGRGPRGTRFWRKKVPEQSVRILLAEDNAVNQKVALQQLRKLGYAADTVATGREVIAAVTRGPYDVILMDCLMPEMDGYEASRRIRRIERASPGRSPAYIIAMTANALAGDREACLAAGMDDYVVKPVKLDDLQAALEQALGRLPARPPAPAHGTAEAATLDLTVLAGLRQLREAGGADPLAELIDLFLQDTPLRVRKMRVDLDRGDPQGLKAAAHSLKGSANNMGARQLAKLCGAVEQAAAKNDLTTIGILLPEVAAEFEKVRERLETEKIRETADK